MRHFWIALLLLGLVTLGVGLWKGQTHDVHRWADTLCTSCIGLTGPVGGH